MTGRLRSVAGHVRQPLADGWQVAASAPGTIAEPGELEAAALDWIEATVPTTAAGALRAAGRWSLDGEPRRFDAEDWWWRVRFSSDACAEDEELALCFDGIATAASVWLDGKLLFESNSMFRAHQREVSLAGEHELVIRCRALDELLKARRPRPRWRVPMLEQQQLRWFRTTLLGRTPGWSPPAAAVGPWRAVRVERRRSLVVESVDLKTRLDGRDGLVEVRAVLRPLGASRIDRAELVVERDGRSWRADLAIDGDAWTGRARVTDVARWWPHTHGEPALYSVRVAVQRGGEPIAVELGDVGFRDIALDEDGGRFALAVNGVELFCRGACWTPLDPVTLTADPKATFAALEQVRDAGMNMIRVGGTMVYEDAAFHDAADRLGILVWQDAMFANMDYPSDEDFQTEATRELGEELSRLQGRPSIAVICGNSEGEQQAAMWGAPRESWSQPLFDEQLRAVSASQCPDVVYWPSSAHRGAFPHQADVGTTSYYGVGAYLRPLEDARRSGVRFASECLAFANVPEPSSLERMPSGQRTRVHHPEWKARSPRDLGAGWDFDDVRDHYVALLFGVDPMRVRYADHDRYLALGRVATGEVMAAAFAEWRRASSSCRGALVWFLRDLWMGAGWGLVDASGVPKSAYYYVRRALQPIAVHLGDEGQSGLMLHVSNDRPSPLAAEVTLALFRGEVSVGNYRRSLDVAAHGAFALPAAELCEGFIDLGYAYRFGPPPCDLVVATLRANGAVVGESFHRPLGLDAAREPDLGLDAEARMRDDGDADVTVRTRRFAHAIALEVEGFRAEDNYFHLAPGAERTMRLRRIAQGTALQPTTLRGTALALNSERHVRISTPA
jgi:beta-mannosidase